MQQQAEDVTDGGDSGLRQRLVPQGQQQLGDQLELPQELSVLRILYYCKNVENDTCSQKKNIRMNYRFSVNTNGVALYALEIKV